MLALRKFIHQIQETMLPISTTSLPARTIFKQNVFLIGLTVLFIAIWLYRYINNHDTIDWFLENILVVLFALYMSFSYKKFKYSDISYFFFFGFLMLHIYGAQYAYTQNPLGEYFQNKYNLWRNPYDRVVHFSFGFLLAYPVRDVLVNRMQLKNKWQYLLPVEIITSLATIFELIEWLVEALTPKAIGQSYVATQGDPYDAHKDIALAILGAAIAMTITYVMRKQKRTLA
jgi:putative membrane protein